VLAMRLGLERLKGDRVAVAVDWLGYFQRLAFG
jgi:hypothetical protein